MLPSYVYQITVHRKCSECPPPISMHSLTRLIMDCRTLSDVAVGLLMVRQASEIGWDVHVVL